MYDDNKYNPLVTVITPTYNREAYIIETVESVLTQDYENIEYIVLDDGSQDNTMDLLQKYKDRIILESHPNMGETATVNKGFGIAKGEIIVVINSDDPLLPGAISKAVEAFEKHPDTLVVYPDWKEIGPDSELIREMKLPDYNLENMLKTFCVEMGPATFFKKQAIDKMGMRDTERKYTGDLEFWFRLALLSGPVHIPEILGTHRVHPATATVEGKGREMADELISIAEKILNHAEAPKNILKQRRSIMSLVYFTARNYCGRDKEAEQEYLKKASELQRFKTLFRLLREKINGILK